MSISQLRPSHVVTACCRLTLGNLNFGAPFCTSLAAGSEAGTLSVAVGGDMMDQ